MIHSTLLIDLQKTISDQLRYNPPLDSYTGEEDDILVFAHSARMAGKYCSRCLVFPLLVNDAYSEIKTPFTRAKKIGTACQIFGTVLTILR